MTSPEPVVKVPYRPWWPVWMLATASALLAALTITFTLVTTTQRAQEAEARAEEERAQNDCRSDFATAISERQVIAATALNDLISLIARQIVATEPPVRDNFVDSIERVEGTNADVESAVEARAAWLSNGAVLPCPLGR